MLVKGVIKDRTLNLSLISIEEEYFRDTRIELFFFFFLERTIGRSSKIFGYNLAGLRARDALTMCIDIMGEYVKGNLPPLTFSFFFNLFTLPKCACHRSSDGNFEMHERV